MHTACFRLSLAQRSRFLSSVAIVIYSFCCHINMFASSFQMNEPTPRRVDKILRRSPPGSGAKTGEFFARRAVCTIQFVREPQEQRKKGT